MIFGIFFAGQEVVTLNDIVKEECDRLKEENAALISFNHELENKLHSMSTQVCRIFICRVVEIT